MRPRNWNPSSLCLAVFGTLCLGWLGVSLSPAIVFAQDAEASKVAAPAPENSEVQLPELQAAQRDYDLAVSELRRLTKAAFSARLAYETGTREESVEHRKSWDEAVEAGQRQRIVLEEAALRLAKLSKEPSRELLQLLGQIHLTYIVAGRWHKAEEFAKVLRGPLVDNATFQGRDGIAAISRNDFAAALNFRDKFGNLVSDMPKAQQGLYARLGELIEKYEREKKFLEQDAAGEPLPRVAFKTTKGRFEVELFEDQAPDTVGNFVYLVEQGYYDDKLFHRVIHDFMAQTGGFDTAKMGKDPGYAIYDEYDLKDSRDHFEGYLSMAHALVPRSASGQFFITLVPTPHLDRKHTVFGRVIDGFDTFESITRTEYEDEEGQQKEIPNVQADYIISAEVIRKRDHEYKPRKVQ